MLYSYYFVLPLALVPATLWQHDCLAKLSLSLTPLNDGVISSVGTAFKNRSLYTLLVRLLILTSTSHPNLNAEPDSDSRYDH